MAQNNQTAPIIKTLLFRRVGDSLLATPALRALKTHWPKSHIIAIAEPQVQRIFRKNPAVDEVICCRTAPSVLHLAALLRSGSHADFIIDFLSDPRSAVACLLSGARRRIGIAGRGRGWMYSDSAPEQDPARPQYSAIHKLALAAAISAVSEDLSLEFFLSTEDENFAEAVWGQKGWDKSTPIAALFIHSRRDYKRWPLANFSALISLLQQTGVIIPLVLSTPGDGAVVDELQKLHPSVPFQVTEIDDLGKLGAVLKKCRLLIGNDGGPKHLAVALGIPTLTIFGHEDPAYWTPPFDQKHVAIYSGSTTTVGNPVWASVDEVWNAVRKMAGMM